MATSTSDNESWIPRLPHRTLSDQAFIALREGIRRGHLKPGERLSIDELARLLGMSKMPIREALRRLEVAGLARSEPYRGTKVADLSVKDLGDIYRARLALEPMAVRSAAERFTTEDENKAAAALRRLDEAEEDSGDAWEAHAAFHFALYEAADSWWLLRLIHPLWEASERYRFVTTILPRSKSSQREHKRILAACKAHDGERAASALYDHLARTANTMAASMSKGKLFELGGS